MLDENNDSVILTVQVKRRLVEAIDCVVKKDTHINRSDWVRSALREKLEREMSKLGLSTYFELANEGFDSSSESL